ncbi:MAG: hypothetical protein M0R70_10375 [Nitrospirae bacterium]|nr:hypothetical protein [Nitrospirota bacterium]
MKKLFVVLGLLLIATMLFVGCGKTDNGSTTNSQLPTQDYNKTGTLQGKIMDAVTGGSIGNDADGELNIWLIQGTENRGADKLDRDINSPLCGEYAFSGIPVDINTGEITFKIVVVKSGYQRFEANVSTIEAVVNFSGNNDLLNTVINMIGNIYLFPLGTTAGDVSVYVYDPQGDVVPNATVLLQQDEANNTETAYTGNRLIPAAGLYTSLTTTTNASGLATFSSADLVLGGGYRVSVEPINIGGMQLAANTPAAFIVGTASTTRVVNMAVTNNALYATAASNQAPGSVTASGVLTVTFNQPIILTTTGFNAAGLASNNTNTNFDFQAVLSADGLTMTLTPNSAITGTTADRAGSVVTFTSLAASNQPFIIKSTQANSGLTLNEGGSELQNITTGSAVSNVVRQLSN